MAAASRLVSPEGASLEDLVPFFKAFCNTTRVRIIELLLAGERCVCEITPSVGGSQPLISHHLAILRDSGFVVMREEGARTYYRVDEEHFAAAQQAFAVAIERARAAEPPALDACAKAER
jgi:ArsR family transcriptional regulator, arsenate/arsenite/antimonite-responsive transcriptional repressor